MRDDWLVEPDATDAEALGVLSADRVWNSFAIADLNPRDRPFTRVAVARHEVAERMAAMLLLDQPSLVVLSPYGDTEGVSQILRCIPLPHRTLIQCRLEHLDEFGQVYEPLAGWRQMVRMSVAAMTFRPETLEVVVPQRLTVGDTRRLERLYDLSPGGLFPREQLEHGVFFAGLSRSGGILSVAGTHAVAPEQGLAVIGGVFTKPSARRQGLARALTSHLTAHLFSMGCRDVVLNVDAENAPALTLYEGLGFRRSVTYYTGPAVLR